MSKNIKLLTVIETLGKGGAERVIVNTLPELKKQGIECEVAIIFDRTDLAEELEAHGIKVHNLNLSYKWNIFEGVYKLFKLIKNNNYNILHAHLFFAYFYTGLVKVFVSRIKIITTFHNLAFDAYPANTLLKKFRKKLDAFIVSRLFNNTTAVSTAVQNHYAKHFSMNNIDIIFNSFPIGDFIEYKNVSSNYIIKKYDPLSEGRFTLLTPGRFVEAKGHRYLIEAVNQLNKKNLKLNFIFVGKGPLEQELKEKSPSNIIFISEIEHSKLMRLYNDVDIIVIPSIHEAFGLVVGEAMIMEKPLIATKVGGIVEMVSDEVDGLLFPVKDSRALANCIEKLYKDKELRLSLVKNAKEKIKQFDTKVIAKQWKEYYENMLYD